MASYDLHLHTLWSYDACTPVEEYFRIAHEKKLRAIAITDHHLMDGYGEVLEAAAKYPDVGYLSGGELSVNSPFGPIDLVCLNLPRRPTPELQKVFDLYHQWQIDCGANISRNMTALGFPFDDAARLRLLRSYRPEKVIAVQGNSHVRGGTFRNYCIEQGYCSSKEDYLAMREKFTGSTPYPEYDVVIPAVKKAGGVVIIAHPYNNYFQKTDRKRMDTLREMFQLDGIECAHPGVPQEITPVYRAYCEEFGLLSSGGTDLHNPTEKRPDGSELCLGGHCGPDRWLDEILERVQIYHGAD